MLTIIKDYSIEDVKRELKRLKEEGCRSPEVRSLALEIIRNSESRVESIFDFVKQNVRYVPDPNQTELFIHPKRMVSLYRQGSAAGDCDDHSLFTASLLCSIGHETRILILDIQGEGYDHAIAQVFTDNNWLNLDTTSKFPLGWEEKYCSRIIIG